MQYGQIITATIAIPGTGYSALDLVTVIPGSGGKIKIDTVAAGVPQTISITAPGHGYVTGTRATTYTGPGVGLKVNVLTQLPPGWGAPPGSGSIEQVTNRGNIVRMRTIQRRRAGLPVYAGSLAAQAGSGGYALWCRQRLAALARYWATNLTISDRSAWDAIALPGMTGFDTFQAWNKIAGPAFADSDSPTINIDAIPFPTPPGDTTPPPDPTDLILELLSSLSPHGPRARIYYGGSIADVACRIYAAVPAYTRSPTQKTATIALAHITPTAEPKTAIDILDSLHFPAEQFATFDHPILLTLTADVLWGTGSVLATFHLSPPTGPNPTTMTLIAGTGCVQIDDQTVTAAASGATNHVDMQIKIDPLPFGGAGGTDEIIFQAKSDNGSSVLQHQILSTPYNPPLALGNQSLATGYGHFFYLDEAVSYPTAIADFTDQYQRLFGQPRTGQNVAAGLRVLKASTGSYTIEKTVSGTIT